MEKKEIGVKMTSFMLTIEKKRAMEKLYWKIPSSLLSKTIGKIISPESLSLIVWCNLKTIIRNAMGLIKLGKTPKNYG